MTPTTSKLMTGACVGILTLALGATVPSSTASAKGKARNNPALHWNQIFIDTLIATSTPNSSSPRLGAIVHTAIFDACNGIERRYTPIFVQPGAAPGASRRAAVIAAAYTALVGLFPSRRAELDSSYAESLAELGGEGADRGQSFERGLRGEPRSHRPCWPGAPTMASVSATRRFPVAWRSASGGPCHPQPR